MISFRFISLHFNLCSFFCWTHNRCFVNLHLRFSISSFVINISGFFLLWKLYNNLWLKHWHSKILRWFRNFLSFIVDWIDLVRFLLRRSFKNLLDKFIRLNMERINISSKFEVNLRELSVELWNINFRDIDFRPCICTFLSWFLNKKDRRTMLIWLD